jgi:hypothetical protein
MREELARGFYLLLITVPGILQGSISRIGLDFGGKLCIQLVVLW